MKLNSRLETLERKAEALLDDSHDAGKRFWGDLFTVAERMGGVKPDEGWFRKSSNKEIAAMALLEHSSGATTPALWAKVKELAGSETPAQRLFAGLEAMHGTD